MLDTDMHLRRDPDSCFTHLQESGVMSQGRNPEASRLAGKCVASPEVFRKITWENGRRVFRLDVNNAVHLSGTKRISSFADLSVLQFHFFSALPLPLNIADIMRGLRRPCMMAMIHNGFLFGA